jgi:hypothetical protein
MKNTPLYLISIVFILATIIILSIATKTTLPNQKNNGFKRKWLGNAISYITSKDFEIPINRICGTTASSIYFSGTDIASLVSMDYDLKRVDSHSIKLPKIKIIKAPNIFFVDSPKVFVHLNNMKSLLLGNLDTGQFKLDSLPIPVFTKSFQLSDDYIVTRGFKPKEFKQSFKTINLKNNKVINDQQIINDIGDGGFADDGTFCFDSTNQVILYVEYFRNKITALTPNLETIFTANTIDTISSNQIQIEKKNFKVNSTTPRVLVNKYATAYKGLLFINSQLRADNENLNTFRENIVIDVYEVKNGKYLGSFYIPNPKNKHFYGCSFNGNFLITLFEKNVSIYNFNYQRFQLR